MRAAANIDAYLADPIGHWIVGKSHLVWTASARLCGVALWGTLGESDVVVLERILFEHPVVWCPYLVLDARRLRSVDVSIVDRIAVGLSRRIERAIGQPRRVAVLTPGVGFLDAVLSGLPGAAGARFECRTFSEPHDAFTWLGVEKLAPAIEAMVSGAAEGAELLARLRAWIASTREPRTIREAARALGVSVRSLQRELAAAGTSFRSELSRARKR
jgi:hypothetical protein